jgi:glycerophosphoryl diester phosphodiesterase
MSWHVFKYLLLIASIVLILSCDQGAAIDIPDTEIGISASKDSAMVDEEILFTVKNGEDQRDYYWEFGDGGTALTSQATHSFSLPGEYIVKVSDPENEEISASSLVRISFSSLISNRQSIIDWLTSAEGTTKICAHRGVHTIDPENSIASINRAIESEIPIVEIDIRLSKDGIPILMHDKSIDRTTNGKGELEDFTVKELKTYFLKKANGQISIETIPTLEEVFQVSRGKQYFDLVIDKKVPFSKVQNIVELYGMQSQVFYYSSESNVINEMNHADSSIVAMPMLTSQNDIDYYTHSNIKLVHLNTTTIADEYLQQIKENGWFTFGNAYVNTDNSPDKDNYNEFNILVNKRISIVQTDYPIKLNK